MANLKDLRDRIGSVKNTQKITSAMKMVAAAKLKRAQSKAEAARPYAERMGAMLEALSEGATSSAAPRLLIGTGENQTHLLLIVTADRGLCGGFNSSVIRRSKRQIENLLAQGKTVKVYSIGRKGFDVFRKDERIEMVGHALEIDRPTLNFSKAEAVVHEIETLFAHNGFDVCTVIYNHFKSVISQETTVEALIPLQSAIESTEKETQKSASKAIYDYEPSEDEILEDLLPQNLAVQIFKTMLDSAAGEQGARMSAMDNATRNAGDMIDRLSLEYNRARQGMITKELIEIVSGAEAL